MNRVSKVPECTKRFAEIAPSLQQSDVTDQELIEPRIESSAESDLDLNSPYSSSGARDETAFSLKRKFCFNVTHKQTSFLAPLNGIQHLQIFSSIISISHLDPRAEDTESSESTLKIMI